MPKRKKCVGCGHRRAASAKSSEGQKICHYMLDTGKQRGCSVEECTHYTTEKCTMLNEAELSAIVK